MSTIAELDRLLQDAPLLANALANLTRGNPSGLDAYIVPVETEVSLEGTETRVHCYFVDIDGNGRPRITQFIERICEHIIDYAIPRSTIHEANEHQQRTGSSHKWVRLANEAKDLFTDLANTGEGGELILFVMAEYILRLPQIICKMSLKTSPRMHYHGSDGVHAGVDAETGLLSLYWGESKMYADVSQAISTCLSSLAPYLREGEARDAAGHRDIKLLSSFVDLNDADIEAAIKAYLDPDNPAFNKLQYCGLAFVGFDSDVYPPEDQRAIAEKVTAAVRTSVETWRERIEARILAEKLARFDIHFICMPFPSVETFRQRFLSAIGAGHVSA